MFPVVPPSFPTLTPPLKPVHLLCREGSIQSANLQRPLVTNIHGSGNDVSHKVRLTLANFSQRDGIASNQGACVLATIVVNNVLLHLLGASCGSVGSRLLLAAYQAKSVGVETARRAGSAHARSTIATHVRNILASLAIYELIVCEGAAASNSSAHACRGLSGGCTCMIPLWQHTSPSSCCHTVPLT